MQSKFIDARIDYDGSQLSPRFALKNFGVEGNSIVAFVGACDVKFEHMKDLEDLNARSLIQADKMLHFIAEVFDVDLVAGIGFQRLLAAIVKDSISSEKFPLVRDGDDIYWGKKKLSVSIAAPSLGSVMIHFGVNIENGGTPVETCALQDFSLAPVEFARLVMGKFVSEFNSIQSAKVKALPAL